MHITSGPYPAALSVAHIARLRFSSSALGGTPLTERGFFDITAQKLLLNLRFFINRNRRTRLAVHDTLRKRQEHFH